MSEDTTTQALAGITWLSEQTPEALRDMLREAPPALDFERSARGGEMVRAR